jgi:hypothetical protein
VPTITFTVDEDGNMDLSLKGPKSIHALKADFDRDLAELGGDAKTVEKPELTETPHKVAAPTVKQTQRR